MFQNGSSVVNGLAAFSAVIALLGVGLLFASYLAWRSR